MQQSYLIGKERAKILRNTESLIRRLSERQVIKGVPADISEEELTDLTIQVTVEFLNDAVCLDLTLDEPLYILGDIFGQYGDLLHMFQHLGFPPKARYLFLGNYVDRGRNSIEVIALLFCYKLKFPNHIFMLRGNHECEFVSCQYGFLGECVKRFSKHLWRTVMSAFDCLPAVAIIENCILCVHSGLVPCVEKGSISDLNQLRLFLTNCIRRPVSLTDNKVLTQLTWAEPMLDTRGWRANPAGLGHNFGENIVQQFCERFGLQLVIRGHDLVEKGYEFIARGKLLTVFSAPNLSGDFNNFGAIVELSKSNESPDTVQGRVKVAIPVTKVTYSWCLYSPLIIEDSLSSDTLEARRRAVARHRATFFKV